MLEYSAIPTPRCWHFDMADAQFDERIDVVWILAPAPWTSVCRQSPEPVGMNAREFGFMVEAGMHSREAIKAATVTRSSGVEFAPDLYGAFPVKRLFWV